MNKRALEDADLYARTGRVKSPSPTPSSKLEEDTEDLELPKIEDGKTLCDRRGYTADPASKKNLQDKSTQLYVLLSSDSEEEFYQCANAV